ncbi:MAG: DNA repair protein RecO [Oscillospiraceae bacterium]|nr:DNA repair protein RecO [Oscillospiraceae bacterium]
MYLKTEGIVLRETMYRDADKILTVLTRDYGKITLKARGVRKNSSRLKGACQLFAYSEFTYQDYGGYFTITEADCREMFPELRMDIETISLACYFAQVTEVLSQEDAPNPAILSLLLNSLYALSKLGKSQLMVKTAFEWRIACLSGYEPMLDGCWVCGSETPDRFNVTKGMLQCASCPGDGLHLPIGESALAALRYLVSCGEKKLFSFTLGEEALRQLGGISETYLMTELERSFSTLELYKSLFYQENLGDQDE